ncbi:hypothetical protein B7P43_G17387 [Cryptotermes secundus]|uniref:ETS domain-containing protein n=1 Tax=Cryptotermes secundus TaxID=105785 RepID=A0A2J7QE23_9NEOP|nr:uncharacterized protein LOC111868148 isoform X2 [Cryptotermes secundus]PNF26838.1 hypothetical protein B7P43_G17387 [Cryptotermes secundus]
MVACENKARESPMPLYYEYCHGNSNGEVHRPQPIVWCRLGPVPVLSKFPGGHRSVIGCRRHSAFQPVATKSLTSDRTRPYPLEWRYKPEAEENTQVTWCCSAGTNYRCAIAVTGVDRFWDLHLRNPGRTYLDKISQGAEKDQEHGGREHEDEGEIGSGDYVSSRDTNSPKCDFRSDESSTCMSPVHESMRRATPQYRSRTVKSSYIKTTCGSIRDFPTAEHVTENRNSFAQNSKQIHARPVYISELPRSQPPPNIHHRKTEYNRPESFSENESILINKPTPLLVSLKDDDKERWLRSSSPHNIAEHFSGEHVTLPTEDDIITKKGGNMAATSICFITEQGRRTSTLSPNTANEENARNSPMEATSDERTTALSAIIDVRDSVQDGATPNTTVDNNSSSNEADYPHELRRRLKAYGMKPAVIARDTPRGVSTAVAVSATESSDLQERTRSKGARGRQDDEGIFILKYPEIGDKHPLCEQSTSSMLRSAARNHTRIRSKQTFEETISSKEQYAPNEYSTHIDEEQPIEDKGESPHKSYQLEYHTKIGDKQNLLGRRVLPHASSPLQNNPIVDEDIFEYRRRDYPGKCSRTVNPTQIGDQHSLEDRADFLQNPCPVVTHIQNEDKRSSEDCNTYLRPNIPSEIITEIGDRELIKNEVVRTEPSSPTKNRTQTADQQFTQSPADSLHSSCPLKEPRQKDAQQRHEGQNISFQRSTVLVQLRDWTPGGEEVFVQQMGAASETKLGADAPGHCLFSAEDTALRSRVLVLLWVLLGERRLREVGYPAEPVHRILWRAVDVCCSVAGVKSAAAVPLNADHDCGLDMLCFRDHTHRFLEVCAPTREHWKQFGWVSLTVDAVVRKIYDEGGRIERVMLWRFLLNLLEDPRNAPCIHWVQRDEGIFRILNTDWLARLWGRRHGNPRMTYEKMARAMRTYYRSKVLQPVPRLRNLPRKLVYKFNPAVIQKVAAMKLSSSTFSGRGLNYNTNSNK